MPPVPPLQGGAREQGAAGCPTQPAAEKQRDCDGESERMAKDPCEAEDGQPYPCNGNGCFTDLNGKFYYPIPGTFSFQCVWCHVKDLERTLQDKERYIDQLWEQKACLQKVVDNVKLAVNDGQPMPEPAASETDGGWGGWH